MKLEHMSYAAYDMLTLKLSFFAVESRINYDDDLKVLSGARADS
jgi:hypothetical protein